MKTCVAVTEHLSRWCKEHLANHESADYQRYHEAFARNLLAKRAEQSQKHENGGLFGMSQAGACLRAAAFRRAGAAGIPPDGDDLITWEIGHLLECMALAVLEAAGFAVSGVQAVARLEPTHQSAADGILLSGPVQLPYPVLLSCKTASYKMGGKDRKGGFTRRGFAALPLDGVRKEKPDWYAQLQLEMAALELGWALNLVVAKDMVAQFKDDPIMQESGSLSWYAELLEADPETAARVQAPYLGILDCDPEQVTPLYWTGDQGWTQLPRPGDYGVGWGGENQKATGKFNPCNLCQFGKHCYPDGREGV